MKLPAMAFSISKFADIAATEEAGATGRSRSRTVMSGELRLRWVEYGPGYLADHWCDRGHVFYLLSGEVVVELQNGRAYPMRAGESFQVSDHGDAAHRVRTQSGGTAFIID